MHPNEINTYNYNRVIFSAIADGSDYTGLAILRQSIGEFRTEEYYTFDLKNRTPVGVEEFIQLSGKCTDPYKKEYNTKTGELKESGDQNVDYHALSGDSLHDVPTSVFNRETGKFNIPELKRWIEAAKFLTSQRGTDWDTVAKRANAVGIKLDYVVVE